MDKTICEVAGSAADEESETGEAAPCNGFAGEEKPSERGYEKQGKHDQTEMQKMRMRVRKHAEGDAGIFAVDQVDEIVDEFVVPALGGAGFDESFGGAISYYDEQCQKQPAKSRRKDHAEAAIEDSISARAAEQRSQMVG